MFLDISSVNTRLTVDVDKPLELQLTDIEIVHFADDLTLVLLWGCYSFPACPGYLEMRL